LISMAVNDRLFNMDVVNYRWIMTGKVGTKIVVARCVCYAQNMPKMRLRPGLCPGPHWGSSQRSPGILAGWEPLRGGGVGRVGEERGREGKKQ